MQNHKIRVLSYSFFIQGCPEHPDGSGGSQKGIIAQRAEDAEKAMRVTIADPE